MGTKDSESITAPHNWLAITHKAETDESAKGPLSASFQVLTLTILGMQDSGDALKMEMGTIKVNAVVLNQKGGKKGETDSFVTAKTDNCKLIKAY